MEQAIDKNVSGTFGRIIRSGPRSAGAPLCIKYVPTKYAGKYFNPGGRLRISSNTGFTWGTGTYVAPLSYPLSSAIFGRVGVVATFDPGAWRVFDATDQAKAQLYVEWLQRQRGYHEALTTMHSALEFHLLRDTFRTRFQIDCVIFRPDQTHAQYTTRNDVWMNVTDWTPSRQIKVGQSAESDCLLNPLACVIVEEEFNDDDTGRREAHLGLTVPPGRPTADVARIVHAYETNGIERVSA